MAVSRRPKTASAPGLQSTDDATLTQALHEAERLLIDVFAAREQAFRSNLTASVADCSMVMDGAPERGWRQREGGGLSVVSRPNFLANWTAFTLGALSQLDWTGIVAAGGSVLGCLLPMPARFTTAEDRLSYLGKAPCDVEDDRVDVAGRSLDYHFSSRSGHRFPWDLSGASLYADTSGFEASDIDLFLVGLIHAQAEAKIRHVHDTLQAAWGATSDNLELLVRPSRSCPCGPDATCRSCCVCIAPWPKSSQASTSTAAP